jgi:hypothetical protein
VAFALRSGEPVATPDNPSWRCVRFRKNTQVAQRRESPGTRLGPARQGAALRQPDEPVANPEFQNGAYRAHAAANQACGPRSTRRHNVSSIGCADAGPVRWGGGVAGQRRSPMHRRHPMRSDITRCLADSGRYTAPEGPGPHDLITTKSLLFQAERVIFSAGSLAAVRMEVGVTHCRPAVPKPDTPQNSRVRVTRRC